MKKIVWLNGNKMLFESEHKTFNRQAKCIHTGNAMGSVQRSGCIRSYSETECNGFTNPEGHLQDYDLQFLNMFLPSNLKEWIRGQRRKMIGHSFFYWKRGRKIFIGWIVTDSNHSLLKMIPARNNQKTTSALCECAKYVSTGSLNPRI